MASSRYFVSDNLTWTKLSQFTEFTDVFIKSSGWSCKNHYYSLNYNEWKPINYHSDARYSLFRYTKFPSPPNTSQSITYLIGGDEACEGDSGGDLKLRYYKENLKSVSELSNTPAFQFSTTLDSHVVWRSTKPHWCPYFERIFAHRKRNNEMDPFHRSIFSWNKDCHIHRRTCPKLVSGNFFFFVCKSLQLSACYGP